MSLIVWLLGVIGLLGAAVIVVALLVLSEREEASKEYLP